MSRNGIATPATDHEIADYVRGLENGNLKSATPNVVRSLIARIEMDGNELAHLNRKIDHGCASFTCQDCDR